MSKTRKFDEVDEGGLATDAGPRPCVGLPVQYFGREGVLPGVLCRQCLTDPEAWDVKVLPSGASVYVPRPAVKHGDGTQPNLPGFGG